MLLYLMLAAAEAADPVAVGLEDEVDSASMCEEAPVPTRQSSGLTAKDVEGRQATGMTPEQRDALSGHLEFVREFFGAVPARRADADATMMSRLLWYSSRMIAGHIVAREAVASPDGTPKRRLTILVETDYSNVLQAGALVEAYGEGNPAAFGRVHTGHLAAQDGDLAVFLIQDDVESVLLAGFPLADGVVNLFGTAVPESDLALVFDSFRWARGEAP